MKVGVIGLGRMGSAIVYRLSKAGHTVVGFNHSPQALELARAMGAQTVSSLQELARKVRIFWLMVPAGDPVDEVIKQLLPHLQKGDILVDGGNSHFSDSQRRYKMLKAQEICFLDCGTSGGLHGKEIGFSLMIGGDKEIFTAIEPLFKAIAAPHGYGYVGPSGAGHYVKMVHNGIEYALLQAYAEGFHVLKDGAYPDLNLEQIANIWNHGSIIRSWILHLAHEIFEVDQELAHISGKIAESGTGKWTVDEAHKQNIPVRLIEDALTIRAQSRETGGNYATKIVALLRNKFGGHSFEKI
jgi:6-phosphogluconate dehydrogenase